MPVPDVDRKSAVWLKPKIFDMDDSEDCVNLLFLDELSSASAQVQGCAYQICLDRKVGVHKLADNCIVIAAGNRTTDKSVTFKMPMALANRLMHFQIAPTYEQWKGWALDSNIDDRVVGYLGFDNSVMFSEPGSSVAFPTPRTWNFVSNLLGLVDDDAAASHILVAGCVGVDTALGFEEWCKINRDLPKVEDIFAGRCHTYPRTHDALYALTAGLTTALYRIQDTVTDVQLDHVCAYALKFPPDFAVSFFGDLNRNEKLKHRLMNCRLFNMWLHQNRHLI